MRDRAIFDDVCARAILFAMTLTDEYDPTSQECTLDTSVYTADRTCVAMTIW